MGNRKIINSFPYVCKHRVETFAITPAMLAATLANVVHHSSSLCGISEVLIRKLKADIKDGIRPRYSIPIKRKSSN
jgi:hypothetical protein